MMSDYTEEWNLLSSAFHKEARVLEWGCGASTLSIAPLVKDLVSIEHHFEWWYKIKQQVPDNVKLNLIHRNKREADGHDGTLQDYYNYVTRPTTYGKFDVIFIDGRARVECARVAVDMLNEGGVIFIHDMYDPNPKCRRYEYEVVTEFLDLIESARCMSKFKPKK